MTAPTHPTDAVMCVVNVNLRQAGVIMLEILPPHEYRVCCFRSAILSLDDSPRLLKREFTAPHLANAAHC